MPALALNIVEQELIGTAAGRTVCALGVSDGMAPLALAAMGARITVADPSQSLLDMLMIRARIIGVELDFVQTDLYDMAAITASHLSSPTLPRRRANSKTSTGSTPRSIASSPRAAVSSSTSTTRYAASGSRNPATRGPSAPTLTGAGSGRRMSSF